MKKRNFYTLLLASMLLTFSAQAQDFDISLPKATVLHQNASGSFNNSWGADATGYLSRMDQWNNNPHRFPWPWFISPTISFSRGFRVGLRFGFGTPGVTSLFGMAGYDFGHNQTYTGIGGNAGPLSLTYGTGGWNASLGFGWQHGFGIEMAGLNYNRGEGLSFNSPFGSSHLLWGGVPIVHQWPEINLGTVSMPKVSFPRIPLHEWPPSDYVYNGGRLPDFTLTGTRLPGAGYSINNAVSWLNNNAHSSWKKAKGQCAKYIRLSLETGYGLKRNAFLGKTPVPARLYGSFLERYGFESVHTTDYLKGDIAVIQGYPGGTSDANGVPYGHIQMYNGSIWISNVKQNGFWPGPDYKQNQPLFVIYRWW